MSHPLPFYWSMSSARHRQYVDSWFRHVGFYASTLGSLLRFVCQLAATPLWLVSPSGVQWFNYHWCDILLVAQDCELH